MNEQEMSVKFQMFEQQIMYLQEQLNFIEQALVDMNNIKESVEEIKSKKDQEILSPLGRGVFVKAKVISDDILVEIGNKSLVTKKPDETKKLIEEQISKINENKSKLDSELKKVEKEMESFFLANQKSFQHQHDHECECEDDECECGKKKRKR